MYLYCLYMGQKILFVIIKISKKMYDLVKHDKKELWFIEGIGHVDGFEHDSTVYFNKIFKFIDSNVLSDKS